LVDVEPALISSEGGFLHGMGGEVKLIGGKVIVLMVTLFGTATVFGGEKYSDGAI